MMDNIRSDCCDLCKLVAATKEHSACPGNDKAVQR